MKALVLGGYGAVGAGIVGMLRAAGDIALAAGRDPARADPRDTYEFVELVPGERLVMRNAAGAP